MVGKYLHVDAHVYPNLKTNPLFTPSTIALTCQVKLLYISADPDEISHIKHSLSIMTSHLRTGNVLYICTRYNVAQTFGNLTLIFQADDYMFLTKLSWC